MQKVAAACSQAIIIDGEMMIKKGPLSTQIYVIVSVGRLGLACRLRLAM